MAEKKINCWEFKQCGRNLTCDRDKNDAVCPAVSETRLDGIHGGHNSGRACWTVAGTFCGGKIQGTFAKKAKKCKACDFYRKVALEEGENLENALFLLQRLKDRAKRLDISEKRLGLLIGGSGLIGGTLMHYFKTKAGSDIEVMSPNSKKLSLREPADIKQYIEKYKPDFIINSAIASIDSDAQLAYEINYLGSVRLAQIAMALKTPYIHISSAATLPMAEDLNEDQTLDLSPEMPNYPKSKLLAEKTLQHLHETRGLDYTVIRLGVVYGKHDHKIQGFHRLLFSIANQAMPVMMTRPGVYHSYSNTQKLPEFIHHIIDRRQEFSGRTYHFVDPEPVELSRLILTIKHRLGLRSPREIYMPYPMANLGKTLIKWLIKRLSKIGVEIRLPAELIFMENFYKTQTLSSKKLSQSSYTDPDPGKTVFSELDGMISYYLSRWEHLNLITAKEQPDHSQQGVKIFLNSPETLLDFIHHNNGEFLDINKSDNKQAKRKS